jgi:hypothetical protein
MCFNSPIGAASRAAVARHSRKNFNKFEEKLSLNRQVWDPLSDCLRPGQRIKQASLLCCPSLSEPNGTHLCCLPLRETNGTHLCCLQLRETNVRFAFRLQEFQKAIPLKTHTCEIFMTKETQRGKIRSSYIQYVQSLCLNRDRVNTTQVIFTTMYICCQERGGHRVPTLLLSQRQITHFSPSPQRYYSFKSVTTTVLLLLSQRQITPLSPSPRRYYSF